jgi:hypothetical protein
VIFDLFQVANATNRTDIFEITKDAAGFYFFHWVKICVFLEALYRNKYTKAIWPTGHKRNQNICL